MSTHSYLGEDDDDIIIFDEIPEDEVTEELSIESPASPSEFEGENSERFEEAFKAEAHNKKLRKSSKDSEEKLSGQKSQSRAESRKNSIQSLQDEIRSLRKSLENDDAQPFQLPSKKSSSHSQISAKSIVSETISTADEGEENETTDSGESSQKSIQLLGKSSRASDDGTGKLESSKDVQKLLVEKKDMIDLDMRFRKQVDRASVGQITLMSFTNTSTMRGYFGRKEKPNTYQLESKKPFEKCGAMGIVESVLSTYLEDLPVYNEHSARSLAKTVANDVRVRLIGNYDRYKILTQVFVGEKRFQGVNIDARCLWDPSRDHLILKQVEKFDYFILVICCGVYHD